MKITEINEFLYKELVSFIHGHHRKHWNKANVVEQLNSFNTHVFVERTEEGLLDGVLLLKELDKNKFYCSLVLALNSKAFANLAKQLEKDFPESEVTSATRRGKLITYKNPKRFLQKIRSIYGSIL